jgi:hypothetical protein
MTQEPWVLMEVSIIIGSDARPIDRGFYAGSILHGSSGMTQALGVPEWGAGMGHTQRNPSSMCMLRSA